MEDSTMKAKDVNPSNFKVENVVFENDDFSIAIGIWENGERRTGRGLERQISAKDKRAEGCNLTARV
jgi:hypothetical protein